MTIAVSVALVYAVASLVKNTLLDDPTFDDPRGVFAHVHQHSRPGDLIYASEAALPSLLYYQPRIGIDHQAIIRTNSLPPRSEHPPSALLPHEAARVWFVFFWPTESGIDQGTLRESGRSGVVLESVTRKLHTAVLWRLEPVLNAPTRR